jgi:hypothetical protein
MSKKTKPQVISGKVFVPISEAVKITGYTRPYIYALIRKKKVSFIDSEAGYRVAIEEVKANKEKNKSRNKKIKKSKNKAIKEVKVVVQPAQTSTFEVVSYILAAVLGLVIGYIALNLFR